MLFPPIREFHPVLWLSLLTLGGSLILIVSEPLLVALALSQTVLPSFLMASIYIIFITFVSFNFELLALATLAWTAITVFCDTRMQIEVLKETFQIISKFLPSRVVNFLFAPFANFLFQASVKMEQDSHVYLPGQLAFLPNVAQVAMRAFDYSGRLLLQTNRNTPEDTFTRFFEAILRQGTSRDIEYILELPQLKNNLKILNLLARFGRWREFSKVITESKISCGALRLHNQTQNLLFEAVNSYQQDPEFIIKLWRLELNGERVFSESDLYQNDTFILISLIEKIVSVNSAQIINDVDGFNKAARAFKRLAELPLNPKAPSSLPIYRLATNGCVPLMMRYLTAITTERSFVNPNIFYYLLGLRNDKGVRVYLEDLRRFVNTTQISVFAKLLTAYSAPSALHYNALIGMQDEVSGLPVFCPEVTNHPDKDALRALSQKDCDPTVVKLMCGKRDTKTNRRYYTLSPELFFNALQNWNFESIEVLLTLKDEQNNPVFNWLMEDPRNGNSVLMALVNRDLDDEIMQKYAKRILDDLYRSGGMADVKRLLHHRASGKKLNFLMILAEKNKIALFEYFINLRDKRTKEFLFFFDLNQTSAEIPEGLSREAIVDYLKRTFAMASEDIQTILMSPEIITAALGERNWSDSTPPIRKAIAEKLAYSCLGNDQARTLLQYLCENSKIEFATKLIGLFRANLLPLRLNFPQEKSVLRFLSNANRDERISALIMDLRKLGAIEPHEISKGNLAAEFDMSENSAHGEAVIKEVAQSIGILRMYFNSLGKEILDKIASKPFPVSISENGLISIGERNYKGETVWEIQDTDFAPEAAKNLENVTQEILDLRTNPSRQNEDPRESKKYGSLASTPLRADVIAKCSNQFAVYLQDLRERLIKYSRVYHDHGLHFELEEKIKAHKRNINAQLEELSNTNSSGTKKVFELKKQLSLANFVKSYIPSGILRAAPVELLGEAYLQDPTVNTPNLPKWLLEPDRLIQLIEKFQSTVVPFKDGDHCWIDYTNRATGASIREWFALAWIACHTRTKIGRINPISLLGKEGRNGSSPATSPEGITYLDFANFQYCRLEWFQTIINYIKSIREEVAGDTIRCVEGIFNDWAGVAQSMLPIAYKQTLSRGKEEAIIDLSSRSQDIQVSFFKLAKQRGLSALQVANAVAEFQFITDDQEIPQNIAFKNPEKWTALQQAIMGILTEVLLMNARYLMENDSMLSEPSPAQIAYYQKVFLVKMISRIVAHPVDVKMRTSSDFDAFFSVLCKKVMNGMRKNATFKPFDPQQRASILSYEVTALSNKISKMKNIDMYFLLGEEKSYLTVLREILTIIQENNFTENDASQTGRARKLSSHVHLIFPDSEEHRLLDSIKQAIKALPRSRINFKKEMEDMLNVLEAKVVPNVSCIFSNPKETAAHIRKWNQCVVAGFIAVIKKRAFRQAYQARQNDPHFRKAIIFFKGITLIEKQIEDFSRNFTLGRNSNPDKSFPVQYKDHSYQLIDVKTIIESLVSGMIEVSEAQRRSFVSILPEPKPIEITQNGRLLSHEEIARIQKAALKEYCLQAQLFAATLHLSSDFFDMDTGGLKDIDLGEVQIATTHHMMNAYEENTIDAGSMEDILMRALQLEKMKYIKAFAIPSLAANAAPEQKYLHEARVGRLARCKQKLSLDADSAEILEKDDGEVPPHIVAKKRFSLHARKTISTMINTCHQVIRSIPVPTSQAEWLQAKHKASGPFDMSTIVKAELSAEEHEAHALVEHYLRVDNQNLFRDPLVYQEKEKRLFSEKESFWDWVTALFGKISQDGLCNFSEEEKEILQACEDGHAAQDFENNIKKIFDEIYQAFCFARNKKMDSIKRNLGLRTDAYKTALQEYNLTCFVSLDGDAPNELDIPPPDPIDFDSEISPDSIFFNAAEKDSLAEIMLEVLKAKEGLITDVKGGGIINEALLRQMVHFAANAMVVRASPVESHSYLPSRPNKDSAVGATPLPRLSPVACSSNLIRKGS